MHITNENTVKSNAWVHLVVSMHITGENTVKINAFVHLVVFPANYW